MGGRLDPIFMYVKFGDNSISSLDFNFTGVVPLTHSCPRIEIIEEKVHPFENLFTL